MGFFKSLFSSQPKEPANEGGRKIEEKNFDILKYDGVRAQKIHKLAYAIRCFEEALNIQEDFETRSFLVAAYVASGKPEEALTVLDKMRELKPNDVDTLLTRIQVLFMLGKDTEVIPDCQAIIAIQPENATAFYLMARAKHVTNDLLGAIADLTRAVTLREDFADAYQLRAEILLKMQQGTEALEDIQKVIELNPEEDMAYLLKGRIHAMMGEIEQADADFHQVLELNPFNEEATLLIGRLLITQNKLDEAIAFFDEAIENAPDQGKFYSERGRAKNLKGDKAGAFEDLKKSIELNPEGEEAKLVEGSHSNFDNLYKGGLY